MALASVEIVRCSTNTAGGAIQVQGKATQFKVSGAHSVHTAPLP